MSEQSKNKILLKIVELHKYFHTGKNELKVLKGINLDVNHGDLIAIMGESGTGKSTLLSLIGGLDYPTSGKIYLRDIEITAQDEEIVTKLRRKYFGYIFQYHFLLNEFTAIENVVIPLLIKKQKKEKDIYNKAKKLLEEVGLGGRINHRPGELSGGECQRVALCRAIIHNPEIVIADEPTGNLDEKNTEHIFELIKYLNKKYKTTFIIATHNHKVKRITRKVYLLQQGKLKKL